MSVWSVFQEQLQEAFAAGCFREGEFSLQWDLELPELAASTKFPHVE